MTTDEALRRDAVELAINYCKMLSDGETNSANPSPSYVMSIADKFYAYLKGGYDGGYA